MLARQEPLPLSKPSQPLSREGMQKAVRMLGQIATVDQYTRLISPADADRIIATAERYLRPCTSDQAITLVAQLIAAYPNLQLERRDSAEQKNFQLYSIKLHEAFLMFSYEIGLQLVDGGRGIPSIQAYRPQPSDIRAMGEKLAGKYRDTIAMARLHKQEAFKRAARRAEEAKYAVPPEVRRAQIERLLGRAIKAP